MTAFCINTIRRFILRCKIDQRSATQIGDAVNKYNRQNYPGTHDFDKVMHTADFEGFLVHHQLKFSSVLALNFRVHTQYAALSTPLQVVSIDDSKFGFVPGRGTTDAIFVIRQLQEKYLAANKRLYMAFVDLESI